VLDCGRSGGPAVPGNRLHLAIAPQSSSRTAPAATSSGRRLQPGR
jgi:hypothetical protein